MLLKNSGISEMTKLRKFWKCGIPELQSLFVTDTC